MAIQSCTPAIVLTRPAEQSQRFAQELAARLCDIRIVTSPLMKTVVHQPEIRPLPYHAVIFTSETGVQAAAGLRVTLPKTAFCVGNRTAEVARRAGFVAQSATGDVVALARMIHDSGAPGPLLHLRGNDSAGDLANTLTNGGVETYSAIIYTQEPQALSAEALACFEQARPVIVPVFSARSAFLLQQALPKPLNALLWIVAISQKVAEAAKALAPQRLVLAARPDGENMLHAVTDLVNAAHEA